jgi:hypothetical protein
MNTIDHETVYDVGVVLINYNSSDYTIDCITSILNKTDRALLYGISIVDNASESTDYNNLISGLSNISSDIPINIFRSKINTGFSAGNMLGLQFISANYYFFLNNDCRLQNDCLRILFNFCESNKHVALCSPQLYHEDGRHQSCIDYFPYLSTNIFGVGILKASYGSRYIKRKAIFTTPVQVDVVSGSQMFVRSSAFSEIGGFDTTFFLYCEEEDVAYSLAKRGYATYLVPEAKNIHAGGGSTTPSMAIKKEFYISFLYFYRKHFGIIRQQLLKIIIVIRLLRKSLSNTDNFTLAIFVASGAHMRHSIRHNQTIISFKK